MRYFGEEGEFALSAFFYFLGHFDQLITLLLKFVLLLCQLFVAANGDVVHTNAKTQQ